MVIKATLPRCECPVCNHDTDAAFIADPDYHDVTKPSPGDLTVCLYCVSFLAFDKNLMLFELTEADIESLSHDDRRLLVKVRRTIKRMREKGDLKV